MRNTINKDSLRRRLTLKHNRVNGRKTVTERKCRQAKFMEERHQRIWPDFDGVSGPGPCHLQRPAALPLRSPPVCSCLVGFPSVGFHQQGMLRKIILYFIWVEWDPPKHSTTDSSRSVEQLRGICLSEVKRWRLATAGASTTDSSPLIGWLISR